MPKVCVWPANCVKSCGAPAQLGHICGARLKRVRLMAGTLCCAWPGCTRRAWVEQVDRGTGEVRGAYSTEGEPDDVLLVACGSCRAARCRSPRYLRLRRLC